MLALIQTLVLALDIYWWIIIASAVFSWLYAFNVVNPRNQFVGTVGNALYRLTEPALRPIRRFMPDLGGIDISPIILLLVLFFLRQILITTVAPVLLGSGIPAFTLPEVPRIADGLRFSWKVHEIPPDILLDIPLDRARPGG